MTFSTPNNSENSNLASRLVRQRSRQTAIIEVKTKWPRVGEEIQKAFHAGTTRYSGLVVLFDEYEELVMIILARLWNRRLKQDPAYSITLTLAEFNSTFLVDLVILLAAQSDPFSTARHFYQAFPDLADQVTSLEEESRNQVPAPKLDSLAFRTKLFGAILYHFLRPLRLLGPQDKPLQALTIQTAADRFLNKTKDLSLAPSLLCATAMAYGDEETITHFRNERSPEIRSNFRKMGVTEPRAGLLVDDIVGTVCLKGCTFFAYGTLAGWLWWLQKSYLRSDTSRELSDQDHSETGTESVADLPDRDLCQDLEKAVAATLASLSPEDRSLLQGLVAGANLVKLAEAAGVAPSTVMRRRNRLFLHLRKTILETMFPDSSDPTESGDRIDEVLRHIPLIKVDLGHLNGQPESLSPPASQEDSGEKENLTPGENCHIPNF